MVRALVLFMIAVSAVACTGPSTDCTHYVSVGAANSNLDCGIYTSTDRRTWTQRECPAPVSFLALEAMAYGNGLFVASSGGGSTPLVRTSTDGLTWSAPATGPASGINGMTFANQTFYAVFGGGVAVSTDPSTLAFADQGLADLQGRAIAADSAGVVVAAGQNSSSQPVAYVLSVLSTGKAVVAKFVF